MHTRSRGDRGQSTVIGVILIVGLTLAGATVIVVLAGGAISDTQSNAEVTGAEQAMAQFDSEASLVAHGSSAKRSVSLPQTGSGSIRTEPSAGSMNIHVENSTGAVVLDTTLTLGALVYEQGDTTVAYQGGGVWRGTEDGSVMVSPPEFDYTVRQGGSPTLTLPLVTIDGASEDVDGEFTVSQTGPTTQLFPTNSATNPLENGEINVTVQSDYYLAWGRYFEDRTEGTVTYDHPNNEATIQLVIPRRLAAPAGISSNAGTLTLQNTGTIDSYDSDDGNYSSSQDTNAVVAVEGKIKTQNAATIKGTVQATDEAQVQNAIDVFGPFVAGSGPSESEITNSPVFRDVFSVQGDATIDVSSGNNFQGDVIVGGDVTSMKNADIDGDLYVGGDANLSTNNTIDGDVIVGGDLDIDKNTEIGGTIEAGNNVTFLQGAKPNNWPSNDVVASGTVTVNQNANVTGDVHAGDEIEIGQNAVVFGNASAGRDADGDGFSIEAIGSGPIIERNATVEDEVDPGVTVNGDETNNTAVASPSPATPTAPRSPDVTIPPDVNGLIDNKQELEDDANNDNDEVAAIDSNDKLSGCSGTCTIDTGEYHLEAPTLSSGETLELDTTSGDITIYVDGTFEIKEATVNVTGDGTVSLYFDDSLSVEQGTSEVKVPEDRSTQLWAFMRPSGTVTFQNDALFQGVVFGPPSPSQDGVDVTIQNQAEIFGAVVGNVQQTSNDNEVHYDETLADATRVGGASQPTTTYLQISTTEIRLEG